MQKRKKVTYIGTTRPLPGTLDVKQQIACAGASIWILLELKKRHKGHV